MQTRVPDLMDIAMESKATHELHGTSPSDDLMTGLPQRGKETDRARAALIISLGMAGGGTTPGTAYGETDEPGSHAAKDKVQVHDLQATILHCFGLDHTKLTYRFRGRDYRLTDVLGEVVQGVLVSVPAGQGRPDGGGAEHSPELSRIPP